jgi:Flp pilus assembly protein TadG
MVHCAKLQPVRAGDWKISGISSVEFAIILPVLLLLVFGMIQYGLGFWLTQVITNGAREGARYGIVVSDPPISDSEVMAQVSNYLNNSGVDASLATIAVNYTSGGSPVGYAACTSGCEVSVQVAMPTTNLVPALIPFNVFPATLTAQAVMRHE